ncbi:hypothetical protein BVX93_01865 [bacterium B13(2017)]|nr:hypothetical protein BVX93_01865 [bacterium B13(2017)]
MKKIIFILFLSINISCTPVLREKLINKKVAVVLYGQSPKIKKFEKTAQARIESIFVDNEIKVLDNEKSKEIKNVWNQLEDPDYFVTDEDFSNQVSNYEVEFLLRVYIKADCSRGIANYYSANAQIDIRLVDKEANTISEISLPMGVPGNPPSDGLTETSAYVNAVQRACDSVLERMGLDLLSPINPYFVDITLKGPEKITEKISFPKIKIDKTLAEYSKFKKSGRWEGEKLSVTTISPDGNYAAIGGYLYKTFTGMQRHHGSNIHLIDLKKKKEVNIFNCEEMGIGRGGTRKVLALSFSDNWRFLAAITGRNLYLWDTQRGRLLDKIQIKKCSNVIFKKINNIPYLILDQKKRILAYKIEKK